MTCSMLLRLSRCRSQFIVYNFNYTVFSNIPSTLAIQQPTAAQYAALCGAISSPATPADPYVIDICGYFSSISNGNVQLLMQTISAYYTARRMSLFSSRKYFLGALFPRRWFFFFHSNRKLHGDSTQRRTLRDLLGRFDDSYPFHHHRRFIDRSRFEHRTSGID